jgi:DNA modification methylase
MGKEWDSDKGGKTQWIEWLSSVMKECHRVLKPGAHIVVWAIPRRCNWTMDAIENAGFEIRDIISYAFGVGFPKSMDVSKQIDKKAGMEREVIGIKPGHEEFANRETTGHITSLKETGGGGFGRPWMDDAEKREQYHLQTAPATEEAKKWEGWGTALKPAIEFWILARKPISEKTIAENVIKWGTGAINIDKCRIPITPDDDIFAKNPHTKGGFGHADASIYGDSQGAPAYEPKGRFPSNLVLSHSDLCKLVGTKKVNSSGAINENRNPEKSKNVYGEYKSMQGPNAGYGIETVEVYECVEDCPIRILNEQSGFRPTSARKGVSGSGKKSNVYNQAKSLRQTTYADKGGASRFFYCPKASKAERGKGNNHPTVKPLKLLTYLADMICPPGGLVLDPFMGSGSTGLVVNNFVGIEMNQDYFEIAKSRLNNTEAL